MSPESEYHIDFRPDKSSEGSNPADHEPIPDVRNEHYPKYFIDEFNDPHYLDVYVQYRIAGGLMKFKESDTGNEYHYAQFPGIEFIPYGVWSEDYNNIPPSEWTCAINSTESGSTPSIQQPSTSDKQCDSGWKDAKCCGEGSIQHQDPTRNSYRPGAGLEPIPNMKTVTITSLIRKTLRTEDRYIACT